jgi:hypothetical protein
MDTAYSFVNLQRRSVCFLGLSTERARLLRIFLFVPSAHNVRSDCSSACVISGATQRILQRNAEDVRQVGPALRGAQLEHTVYTYPPFRGKKVVYFYT